MTKKNTKEKSNKNQGLIRTNDIINILFNENEEFDEEGSSEKEIISRLEKKIDEYIEAQENIDNESEEESDDTEDKEDDEVEDEEGNEENEGEGSEEDDDEESDSEDEEQVNNDEDGQEEEKHEGKKEAKNKEKKKKLNKENKKNKSDEEEKEEGNKEFKNEEETNDNADNADDTFNEEQLKNIMSGKEEKNTNRISDLLKSLKNKIILNKKNKKLKMLKINEITPEFLFNSWKKSFKIQKYKKDERFKRFLDFNKSQISLQELGTITKTLLGREKFAIFKKDPDNFENLIERKISL